MCWLCALGHYVEQYEASKYDVRNVDKVSGERGVVRFALHNNYEHTDVKGVRLSYEWTVRQSVTEGLCRNLGPEVMGESFCKKVGTSFLDLYQFQYMWEKKGEPKSFVHMYRTNRTALVSERGAREDRLRKLVREEMAKTF